MPKIHTIVEFEAAHRQLGDLGKCGKLHGHNWIADVIVSGPCDKIGYVIDFKNIKEEVMFMDHCTILKEDDPLVQVLNAADQKVFCITDNPTCENIAKYLLAQFEIRYRECKFKIKVWENSKSWAEVPDHEDN